jgi:hypothetical protein
LIDRLTEIPAQGYSGETRPVLVIEGCGGSGRTALLKKARDTWQGTTPTVLVCPQELVGDEDSAVRPVLAAVMLGLSLGAPGYAVAFERVLLAQIAIATPTTGLDPEKALEALRHQTNNYRDRNALIGLVGGLVEAAGALATNIGIPAITPVVTKRIAERVVGRLQRARWTARLNWSREALTWFGHQDQNLGLDPERARLQLGNQARSTNSAVRRGVDDLLVAALLADLRHSLATAVSRQANVLVLLDDGDLPSAMSFTSALLRVRQTLANTPGSPGGNLPDPLTMVTTSSGALVGELTGGLPAPVHWEESSPVEKVPTSVLWLRVSSENLKDNDVIQLAKTICGPTTSPRARSATRYTG